MLHFSLIKSQAGKRDVPLHHSDNVEQEKYSCTGVLKSVLMQLQTDRRSTKPFHLSVSSFRHETERQFTRTYFTSLSLTCTKLYPFVDQQRDLSGYHNLAGSRLMTCAVMAAVRSEVPVLVLHPTRFLQCSVSPFSFYRHVNKNTHK